MIPRHKGGSNYDIFSTIGLVCWCKAAKNADDNLGKTGPAIGVQLLIQQLSVLLYIILRFYCSICMKKKNIFCFKLSLIQLNGLLSP